MATNSFRIEIKWVSYFAMSMPLAMIISSQSELIQSPFVSLQIEIPERRQEQCRCIKMFGEVVSNIIPLKEEHHYTIKRFHISLALSISCSLRRIWRSIREMRLSTSATKLDLSRTPLSYQLRKTISLLFRRSAISAACASCVASIAFILPVKPINSALSAASGIGLSLIAVSDEEVAGNDAAEASTIDRIVSGDSCEGGSEGSGE